MHSHRIGINLSLNILNKYNLFKEINALMKYIYIIIYGLCNLEIRSEKSLHTPFKVHVMTITECKYILIMLGKRSRL